MAVGEVMRMEIPAGGDLPVTSPELHVLAVDDSIVDRKVIERLLRISACKVTTVESGTRALQYLGLDGDKGASGLKDLKVNLIVTDYSMPGLTGYDLLKKIKESSAFREIPVVIMSSENILPRIEQCLKEGAEDFLLKPVKLADVKRIKQLIMRNEAEDCKTLSHSNKRKLGEDIDTSSPPSSSSSDDDSSVKDFPSSQRMKSSPSLSSSSSSLDDSSVKDFQSSHQMKKSPSSSSSSHDDSSVKDSPSSKWMKSESENFSSL